MAIGQNFPEFPQSLPSNPSNPYNPSNPSNPSDPPSPHIARLSRYAKYCSTLGSFMACTNSSAVRCPSESSSTSRNSSSLKAQVETLESVQNGEAVWDIMGISMEFNGYHLVKSLQFWIETCWNPRVSPEKMGCSFELMTSDVICPGRSNSGMKCMS